jgi:hypothetical protein
MKRTSTRDIEGLTTFRRPWTRRWFMGCSIYACYACTCVRMEGKNVHHSNAWTGITNFMKLNPSPEAASCVATQHLPKILWTRTLVAVFKRAFHWSLSWARSIQYTAPHTISLRIISISYTHLRINLPTGLFPSGFPYKHFSSSASLPFVLQDLPI